jgi:hypothetical protein
MEFPQKLTIELPYDSTIPHLAYIERNVDLKTEWQMCKMGGLGCLRVGGGGERRGYRGWLGLKYFIHMYENRVMKPVKIV